MSLKNSTTDILLITGVLSSHASVVEKLHKELPDKNKATLLKIERAGDVLLDAVSYMKNTCLLYIYFFFKNQKEKFKKDFLWEFTSQKF